MAAAKQLLFIRVRTLAWAVLPLTVAGLMPWWVCRRTHAVLAWQGTWPQWLGLWLILNGVALTAWCVNLFNVQGGGTPLPLDPPTRFVVSGPYRWVRNPMMLGMFLVLGGEALFSGSAVLWGYLLVIVILAQAFVRCWEEPDLARRFGSAYRDYQRQIPRWIPTIPRRPSDS